MLGAEAGLAAETVGAWLARDTCSTRRRPQGDPARTLDETVLPEDPRDRED